MVTVDLLCSGLVVAFIALVGVAYLGRLIAQGRARHARVDRDRGSVLLGKGVMEMAYWAMRPIVRAAVRAGATPNAITWGAAALSLVVGVALATGHFGLAAALALVASLGDALDGLVARETGLACDAGEVLDAAADRYAEFFFLGGLAVWYRGSLPLLSLVLASLLASFMVSYGTAKAEALHVEAPRGAMRRAERAFYLGAGALLTPFFQFATPVGPWGELPMLAAVALVAVIGNVSAFRRLAAVVRTVERERPRKEERALQSDPPPALEAQVPAQVRALV